VSPILFGIQHSRRILLAVVLVSWVVPAILLIDIYPSRLTRHRTRHILLAVVLASWVMPVILLINIYPSRLTRYRT